MPEDLVRWRELKPTFDALFPRTIQDALLNCKSALVPYLGITFEIRPLRLSDPMRLGTDDFEVYGPPHVNSF